MHTGTGSLLGTVVFCFLWGIRSELRKRAQPKRPPLLPHLVACWWGQVVSTVMCGLLVWLSATMLREIFRGAPDGSWAVPAILAAPTVLFAWMARAFRTKRRVVAALLRSRSLDLRVDPDAPPGPRSPASQTTGSPAIGPG